MKSRWFPRLMFALGAIPFFWLAWRWHHHQLGINAVETVARYTGDWTIRFLMLTLAITPLRHIPGLQALARLRRMAGLYTFFYATLHALHYWARDVQWNWQIIQEDLTYRRFFIAGMIAWTLMIPLAATSFDRAIRWMGGAAGGFCTNSFTSRPWREWSTISGRARPPRSIPSATAPFWRYCSARAWRCTGEGRAGYGLQSPIPPVEIGMGDAAMFRRSRASQAADARIQERARHPD